MNETTRVEMNIARSIMTDIEKRLKDAYRNNPEGFAPGAALGFVAMNCLMTVAINYNGELAKIMLRDIKEAVIKVEEGDTSDLSIVGQYNAVN